MVRILALVFVAALAVPSPAADKKKIGSIEFTLPKGWTVAGEKPDVITFDCKEKKLTGLVLDIKDLKADVVATAKKKPDEFLKPLGLFDTVTIVDKPEEEKDGGLVYTWSGGKATLKADKAKGTEWQVMFVEDGKSPIVVLVFGQLEKHEDEVEAFYDSFSKVKKKKK